MGVGQIHEFEVKGENWSVYCERLDMYFLANKIEDGVKLATLVAVMGEEAYQLLSTLASPKQPSALTYTQAVELLKNHLQPKPSVLAERYKFRQRRQVDGETTADYVAELKKLAKTCDFGSTLEENLRDQLVCGIISESTRQRLFAEDDIAYSRAVRLATTLESAEKNACAVDRHVNSPANVNKIQYTNNYKCKCMACGDSGHKTEGCKYRNFECSYCHKLGHLRRMCQQYKARLETAGTAGNNLSRAGAGAGSASAGVSRRSGDGGERSGGAGRGGGSRGGGATARRWGRGRGAAGTYWVSGPSADQDDSEAGRDASAPSDYESSEEDDEEAIYQMSLSRYKPQCPQTRDGALNVHMVPHSHMDAGWVKTFDEYYYGTKSSVSTANVQLIYHSVLSELLHDKRRKFTFSETAYFWRWWKEQRPATRTTFRSLVQEGRIEFAGGGWVQNDEATLDYLQIIDQFTWGLRKLNDTLGPCGKPKAAWQIDSYGHSREQTSLLAQMGFDGLFLGRMDHREREAMIEEDRMEFMWRGSDVLGKMSDIMTHSLFNLYNAPDGFCFDFLCSDEPIVDDPDNRVYNAEKRVNDFVSQIERQAKYYDHDNIMVTMGGDFTYQGAANWFMNIDKLINHVNTHPANISDVNIFYSTPSCYLKAIYLYGRRDKAIYTERGDHMPYGSDRNTYWTGYYTSRPSLKYLIRKSHIFLQVVKQLTVIARMGDSFELHLLRHAVNLVFHHDAITGTSQQHVTNDFIRTLGEAVDVCTKKVSNLLSHLTPTWGASRRSKNSQQFIVCHQLNMSQCRFTETQETMLLLVYNPLSVKTYHHVRMPAIALHYSIRDYNDEEVEYQLVPLPAATINLPGRSSTAIQELCFEAENIPPLGFSAYFISPVRDQLEENEFAKKVAASNKNQVELEQELVPTISNEYLKIGVNKDTGFLEYIQHVDGVRVDLSQNFHFYSQGSQGLQSGAYSFRPTRNRPTPVTDRATYHTVRGTLVKEIRQRFTDWITQTIRLYRGEEFVELEWIIGPVPIGTDLGKEVVTLFQTNVTSNGHFYTDSNSRQMMRRTCWNESSIQQQKKPVASCYYPVTSRICIQSQNTSVSMCVLTDRTQGATSYNQGEMELMVHRRLLTDDGFGLEEPLNEEAYGVGLVVKGKHRIIFGNFKQEIEDQTFDERAAHAARRWLMEPWLFFTPGEKLNRRKWMNIRSKRYSALRLHALPRHVNILTLEPWKGGSVLLRLENTLENPVRGRFRNEKAEGLEDLAAKSSHITVQLRQLFLQMKIKMVRETTLAANQWLDDARQMDWSTRYVYSGADDEMLAEDAAEFRESFNMKDRENKEQERYSEEDQAYNRKNTKKRKQEKGRSKIKLTPRFDDNDRRKRSANISDNIIENIINGTFKDKEENSTKSTSTTVVESTTEFINATTKVDTLFTIAKFSSKFASKASPRLTKSPVLSYIGLKNSWIRPSKFFVDLDRESEEGGSSEEDVSSNMKKRSPRRKTKKKKTKEPEIEIDDSDDGITKSIYEMYYKTNTRPKPFKTFLKSAEEITERHRRRNRKKKRIVKKNEEDRNKRNRNDEMASTEDYTSDSKRKSRNKSKKEKMLRADMPFFITEEGKRFKMTKGGYAQDSSEDGVREELGEKKEETDAKATETTRSKRREDSFYTQDYESVPIDMDEEEKEMENYDRENERRRFERKKRDSPTEEPQPDATSEQTDPEPDPDYVITLRPTQIRTFVVWFENNRKPYTM